MDSPIPGGRVQISGLGSSVLHSVRTNEDGQFGIRALPPGSYTVRIEAPGFSQETRVVEITEGQTARLDIILQVAALTEAITVTATRGEQKLGDVPASVHVVTRKDLELSAALTADDALRQVPTFSLFRRTSSLVAHPTAQGVSLRGVGPSGVSRSLVLLDNVPFNDPFGGWVYWSRLPLLGIDQIEIVEGPTSHLYGNYAMGGAIHVLTKKPERRTLMVQSQYGNRGTPKMDFFASDVWGPWGVALDGSLFHTEGYRIVAPRERGRVDTEANSDSRNLNLKLDFQPRSDLGFFVKGSYFGEGRQNGTFLQENDTQWRSLSGGLRLRTRDGSQWQLTLFSHFQTFGSTFSTVAPDRNSERLSLIQEVPTHGLGGSGQWSRRLFQSHELTAGIDWRWIDGHSDEQVFAGVAPSPVRLRVAGGRQRMVGVFLQDLFNPLPRLQVSLSARLDRWRNYDAFQNEKILATGQSIATPFADKDNSVASPRLGLRYHLTARASIWGAFSWGFRAPTLNELYRQFRVGNVVTLANDQLGPERLIGVESGVHYVVSRKLFWRVTGFWNRVKDPVSNVTLSVAPTLITRQRQNLGRTRIRGLQTEADYRPHRHWGFGGAYLFNEATIQRFPSDLRLVGNRLPQVAKHRLTLQALYSNPKIILVALQGRWAGAQFDDDLNLFRLGGYFVTDLTVARPVTELWELFFGIENLLNRHYLVGSNPSTVGTPALVHGGVRLRILPR